LKKHRSNLVNLRQQMKTMKEKYFRRKSYLRMLKINKDFM